jgi:hypothetical protein
MSKARGNDLASKAPIERIFRRIVGRDMTINERRVLLRKPKKKKA